MIQLDLRGALIDLLQARRRDALWFAAGAVLLAGGILAGAYFLLYWLLGLYFDSPLAGGAIAGAVIAVFIYFGLRYHYHGGAMEIDLDWEGPLPDTDVFSSVVIDSLGNNLVACVAYLFCCLLVAIFEVPRYWVSDEVLDMALRMFPADRPQLYREDLLPFFQQDAAAAERSLWLLARLRLIQPNLSDRPEIYLRTDRGDELLAVGKAS